MKLVEGTYELTSYSGDTNWLEERGMKLIMVIRADGTGYYGYKANNKDPFISELRCRFVRDTENPDKYQYVEIDFTGNGEYTSFGIYATFSEQKLNYSTIKWKDNILENGLQVDYHISVGFTRTSKATDRSVIDEHFSGSPVLPLGIGKYSGTYEFTGLDGGVYPEVVGYYPPNDLVYFYLDINFAKGSAKAYYMLKSDEKAQEIDLKVSVSRTDTWDFLVKIGEREAALSYGGFSGNQIRIFKSGSEYYQLTYLGTLSHETIVINCEETYARYLSGLDFSEE